LDWIAMASTMTSTLDVAKIRADFPILERRVHDKPLVYLDSAASSQKPVCVIEAMDQYYRTSHANVHRGVHTLSEEATGLYEGARKKIARFINARSSREIIYTRNATESINLVAFTWGRVHLQAGDEILLTESEHHSNIVPWQMLAREKGAVVRYIPVDAQGYLDTSTLDTLLTKKTKIVGLASMSNVLGTILPVEEVIQRAHRAGALVLIDGAQGVPHLPTDVQALDCDFLAFSGHKMCGPTGIGVLWGRRDLLEEMPPFLGGGDMIRRVTYDGADWNELPWKFEAGTPAIAEAIGLGAAIDYLTALGMPNVRAHEREIIAYALDRLAEVPGLTLIGPDDPDRRGGVATFTLDDIHPHDVAAVLDIEGVAIRAGHHCAMPLHQKLGIVASSRASFYIYSTPEEVDHLVEALYKVKTIFKR
jgi:cysteine desulfurase/selenocysteine lyase